MNLFARSSRWSLTARYHLCESESSHRLSTSLQWTVGQCTVWDHWFRDRYSPGNRKRWFSLLFPEPAWGFWRPYRRPNQYRAHRRSLNSSRETGHCGASVPWRSSSTLQKLSMRSPPDIKSGTLGALGASSYSTVSTDSSYSFPNSSLRLLVARDVNPFAIEKTTGGAAILFLFWSSIIYNKKKFMTYKMIEFECP